MLAAFDVEARVELNAACDELLLLLLGATEDDELVAAVLLSVDDGFVKLGTIGAAAELVVVTVVDDVVGVEVVVEVAVVVLDAEDDETA